MRYAVKVAYDGARFHGSQVQPGVRTVHGELARALADLQGEAGEVRWAGRTDAGVSAAGNVAVFESPLPASSLLPGLTFRMKDAWAWASAEVDARFEPRHATRRRYRYRLRSALDAAAVAEAMAPFVGEHDFTAFARLEPGVEPRRRVESVAVERRGAFLVVDVVGESFLWNQVRRMVEAGRRAAAGDLATSTIADALAAGKPADLGTAPPEPLLLLDVEYDHVEFARPSTTLLERLDRRLEALELEAALLEDVRDAAWPRL